MNRPIRVLELRSVWGTGGGPEKTILIGAARTTGARRAHRLLHPRHPRRVFALDRRAGELDVDYVEVLERHSFDRGDLAATPRARPRRRDRHRARARLQDGLC